LAIGVLEIPKLDVGLIIAIATIVVVGINLSEVLEGGKVGLTLGRAASRSSNINRSTCTMVGSSGGGGLPPPWPRVPVAILETKVCEKRARFMLEQGINKELNNHA
jgi:hypothetical protein